MTLDDVDSYSLLSVWCAPIVVRGDLDFVWNVAQRVEEVAHEAAHLVQHRDELGRVLLAGGDIAGLRVRFELVGVGQGPLLVVGVDNAGGHGLHVLVGNRVRGPEELANVVPLPVVNFALVLRRPGPDPLEVARQPHDARELGRALRKLVAIRNVGPSHRRPQVERGT
jgi:hypothetical protein